MTNSTKGYETMTVNEVIRRVPEAVTVFGEFGIDACCGGNLEVEEAARRHGVALDRVLEELEGLSGAGG